MQAFWGLQLQNRGGGGLIQRPLYLWKYICWSDELGTVVVYMNMLARDHFCDDIPQSRFLKLSRFSKDIREKSLSSYTSLVLAKWPHSFLSDFFL